MFEENWITISPLASNTSSPVNSVESKETVTKSSPTDSIIPNALTRTLLIAPIFYKILKIEPAENYYEILFTLVVAWNQISEDDCWEPKLEEDIYFEDTMVQKRKSHEKSNFTFKEAATLVNCKEKMFHLHAKVHSKMVMDDYPFDKHCLALRMHFAQQIQEVLLEPHLVKPSFAPSEDVWIIASSLKNTLTTVTPQDTQGETEKILLMEVSLQRNPIPCIQEILIPTTILTCFAFACFFIDHEDIGARMNILFAVIVTLLLWRYTTPLPPLLLPNTTTMHRIASLQTCLVFLMIMESMLVVNLERDIAMSVDETIAIILILCMAFFLVGLCYHIACFHRMMRVLLC